MGWGQRRYRQRGQVLVLTLLAVLLIAGLLAYVLNLGQQANNRLVTQHAADAAAIGGATWIARGLNTVAMNNVGTARLISEASLLDALPQAVEYTREDETALRDALRAQLSRPLPPSWSAGAAPDRITDHLNAYLADAEAEWGHLDRLDQLFNRSDFDVRSVTYYHAPSGRGQLWRAMLAMQDVSEAAMESLGELAYVAAVEGGRENLAASARDWGVVLLPAPPSDGPKVPWKRGEFDDFERPVRYGLLPPDPHIGDAQSRAENRGPFDTVFGWRDLIAPPPDGYSVGGGGQSWGGSGHVGIGAGGFSGDPPRASRFVVTRRYPPDAYRTYGTQRWLTRAVLDRLAAERFRFMAARLGPRLGQLAEVKLRHVWSDPAIDPGPVYEPEWITDFDTAVRRADAGAGSIRETAFVAVEVKSRYPRGSPSFMSPGSWAWAPRPTDQPRGPRLVVAGGWQDPRRWGVPQVADHVWRDEWQYRAGYDAEIGLGAEQDARGNPVMQTVYRVDDFIFVGVNTGEQAPVRNPFNFGADDELPRPIDFDHAAVATTPEARRRYLTLLGVARHDDRAALWPSKFAGHKPYPGLVAVAQAKVFNDHSWDLWTQMWQAQLEPVRDFDAWAAAMGDTAAAPPVWAGVTRDETAALELYFQSVAPLAETMLTH